MISPNAVRWLHRLGYLNTLIVFLEMAGGGWITFGAWQRNQQLAAAAREATRTHVGPITPSKDRYGPVTEFVLLAKLPPRSSLTSDSQRFVAMPSFGKRWFATSLSNQGSVVRGMIVIAKRNADGEISAEVERRQFVMPPAAYAAMMVQVDRLCDGWPGETDFWTDGTPVAFERMRGGNISSGEGNSPKHYGELAMLMRNGLSPYVKEVAELNGEWMDQRH